MKVLNENGKTFLSGMMSQADTKNRNGRVYPKHILKEAVLKLIEDVNSSDVYSEKEHPDYFEVKYNDNVCGILREVTWDDSTGCSFCKVELVEGTTGGDTVIKAVNSGKTVGISTRGMGSLTFNEQLNAQVVQNDLVLSTADVIVDGIQSCQTCSLKLDESVETYFLDDVLFESECGCDINEYTDEEKKILENYISETIIRCFK